MNADHRTDEELDERLRSGFARLASAVPVVRTSEARASGVANVRVAAHPRARFGSGAGAMVGALALLAVVVVTALLANRPADDRGVAAPVATSVSSSASDDAITLTVTAARGQYTAGEPIDVTATLAYRGPAATLQVGTSPDVVGFGVAEVGGTRQAGPASRLSCQTVVLERGSPATYPFVKSGGFAADSTDPNVAFVKEYLDDPVLRLPAGTWKVFAQVDLFEGTCGLDAVRHQLEASVVVTVTDGLAPSTGLPTPIASPSPLVSAPTSDDPGSRGWVRIETLDLVAGLHGTAHFIGAGEGAADQPCTADYEAVTSVVDGVLQVGVIEHAHPAPTPVGDIPMICDAMGHPRTATFELAVPYTGAKWRDLAGYTSFLSAPAGLAAFGALPAGWAIRQEADFPERALGGWVRIWARSGADDPSQWLTLYQLFGVAADFSGDGSPTTVQVNGRPATLYGLDAGSTTWLVLWRLGEDGMALEAPLQDFSRDEVIRLAESVTAP
jgi:hypothetical protein